MAMVFPAYDAYDSYGHLPLSRRQSMVYGTSSYPYSRQGIYPESIYGYERDMYNGPGTVALSRRMSTAYNDDMYYPASRPPSAMGMPRSRRHSTVSTVSLRAPPLDAYRRASSVQIKFKRRGSLLAGVSLAEAQSHVRLSSNDSYTAYDLHADRRNTILLKVKWAGYNSLTYEIPLDSYDRHISLQTLARRVSRACVHYLQVNAIPVMWDRVELHHLEELSYGTWQPMLAVR
ncbi:hypothetical protein Moror_1460 [Moniliophthora roreri MCA 2997]|uniref:DUF6741 domain-containing protein n=2 Tax=Moniliophthora roreri TaxID=221103 RepID=V2XJ66_MONRO|nr:hypothetical protein Moror_1460 [Moniliophthora roreri MCA 2997]